MSEKLLSDNSGDIRVLQVVVNKLDETIEKISESTHAVSRLLAVHDERIDNLERDTDDANQEIKLLTEKMEKTKNEIISKMQDTEIRIENKISESKDQSTLQHKQLSDKVDQLDARIKDIENWRWYIAGGLAVFGFLISKSELFLSFLKH
jgi:chromosome segregation ATPase